ncbi:MAG: hypothetical protein WCI19_16010 [Betaproteobacteria bacterium]
MKLKQRHVKILPSFGFAGLPRDLLLPPKPVAAPGPGIMSPLWCVCCACYSFSIIGLLFVGPAAASELSPAGASSIQPLVESDGLDRTATTRQPASGITDLKFREMFKLPVGSGGLEPSRKLLRLDGRPVHIVGYMVEQEQMRSFILAPLPLKLGDEDESLADDLPPGVVFVHAAAGDKLAYKHVPGLLELTGILSVGNFAEADDRVSMVRLMLDPVISQEVSSDGSRK